MLPPEHLKFDHPVLVRLNRAEDQTWYRDEKLRKVVLDQAAGPRPLVWVAGVLFVVVLLPVAILFLRDDDAPVRAVLITAPIGMMVVAVMGAWVRRRKSAETVRNHLCLTCRYSLKRAAVDPDGYGQCPECGRGFNVGYYKAEGS